MAIVVALLCAPAFAQQAKKALPPAAERKVEFARDIQPIFARHCYSCHGSDQQESNYRLDNPKQAFAGGDLGEKPIVAGKSADSPLVQYISGIDESLVMPPKGPRLSGDEVGLIRAWIDQGAEWAEVEGGELTLSTTHWSFQPLKPVAIDAAAIPAGGNAIDALVIARLKEAGLTLAPPADRVTLIRRLYLDMLGLPPDPEEIAAFVADDRPEAYERQVERVLASPRYGERWARHWLDVVRFAETNGFETNVERPNAWPYRDYVIDAFNSDKPYDQFIIEQIAGDAAGADVATGFLVGGPWDEVKSPDPVLTAMQRADELSDMTNTTATAFLGLTVGCARCHNHKFDPILQKDYYAIEAVLAGVRHGQREVPRKRSPAEQRALTQMSERLESLQAELAKLQPQKVRGLSLLLDDETLASDKSSRGVVLLAEKAGHGVNPPGEKPGHADDRGNLDRYPNASRGRYTWWHNRPGEFVMAYRPAVEGRHRLWLSWGCGYATHTVDAEYWLDRDGQLETTDDRTLLATIDQQQFAGERQPLPSQPLWSGFAFAGVHELEASSLILLRGGSRGTAVTADVIALEEVDDQFAEQKPPSLPPLRAPARSRENTERFSPVVARYVRFTSLATNSGTEPCLDELEIYTPASDGQPSRNVALASAGTRLTSSGDYQGDPSHRLEHLNDGQHGNGRSWISNTAGTGWVQLEFPEAVTIERIVWGRDRHERYRDRTPTEYVIEVATEPGRWQVVASSAGRLPFDPRQREAPSHWGLFDLPQAQRESAATILAEIERLHSEIKRLTKPQVVYAGRFEQPGTTHRLFRGDPMQPREAVAPDCLSVMGSLGLASNTPEQQRRLALARWIASAENPLAPRVMVNRIWQHHFGTGIVDTPSDFGVNGARPSHPELLDWLAQQFIQHGWSVKHLHREILLSQTYRQSNQIHAAGMERDAQCRLLWRYPSRRLEAEAIRDSILATSGALDLRMGGPGWSAFKPNTNYVRVYEPKEEFGPAEWRRAIYMTKVRMRQDGVFGAFDCPDAGQIAPKRARSTTALQALNLLNSPFVLQQAQMLAERIKKETGDSTAAQVERAFVHVLGRRPEAGEAEDAAALVSEHGLPALCRALYNTSEFLFIP